MPSMWQSGRRARPVAGTAVTRATVSGSFSKVSTLHRAAATADPVTAVPGSRRSSQAKWRGSGPGGRGAGPEAGRAAELGFLVSARGMGGRAARAAKWRARLRTRRQINMISGPLNPRARP